ncbi:MAG: class I SAM-dependent methyltransferase, partial [Mycobacteriaceae bacterium]|nr:class I SAM-dependent methyltransferase [Mycobacteriaceae bacterium]
MPRTDNDTWDLAHSVGATATGVAVGRALASQSANALIDDPYAAPLVRAVGIDFFTRLVDGDIELAEADGDATWGMRRMTEMMAVRTRFFDEFFLNAARDGVQQAVILASGLDARAYRLPWPPGTTVYEIDQPQVIDFKTRAMRQQGVPPTADRRAVAVDLRHDWPAALRKAGFSPELPAAWSAEGLLAFLPPDAQDRLLDNLTELSAPGSRFAAENMGGGGEGAQTMQDRMHQAIDRWREHGFDVDMTDLWYFGERNDVSEYLSSRGWSTVPTL